MKHQLIQYSCLTDWVQEMFEKVLDRRHAEIKDPMRQLEVIQDYFQFERAELNANPFTNAPEAAMTLHYSSSKICVKSEDQEKTSPEREPIDPEATKAQVFCAHDDHIAEESMNFIYDQERVLESYQDDREKIKEKIDDFREQIAQIRKLEVMNSKAIRQMKEQLHYLQGCKYDPAAIRKKTRELSEKLSEFYEEIFGRFCSPSYPFAMLADLEKWIIKTTEDVPLLIRRRKQRELFEAYDPILRKRKEAKLKALERAFAPPPLVILKKKQMPRSPPLPKIIRRNNI
ncbi:uncharacterized protein [Pseudorasbora parva]|uniref:uncharacterized protein n=1 Tax=Pseudorasbora parva TaxID=51549 RepID=UPI00351F4347